MKVIITFLFLEICMLVHGLIRLPGQCPTEINRFTDFTVDEISEEFTTIAESNHGLPEYKNVHRFYELPSDLELDCTEFRTDIRTGEQSSYTFNFTVDPQTPGYFKMTRQVSPDSEEFSEYDAHVLNVKRSEGIIMFMGWCCRNVNDNTREEEMQIWARGERLAIDKLVLDAIEEVKVNNPLLDQSLDYIQAFQQPRIFRQVRREFNGRVRNGRKGVS